MSPSGSCAVVVFLADVQLATDDRLDARMLVRRVDKMDCAKNVAMVGHGHGGHAQLLHALAEFFDITGAVEQGIVSMQMQVDELRHGFGSLVYRNRDRGKLFVSVRIREG